jgi:hypothetical protein
MPGAAGGIALRDRRGLLYLQQIGGRGGAATLARYGREHMARLGERGRAARRLRKFTQPRTEVIISRHLIEIHRIVPYWPPRRHHRRRRPIFVRIYIFALDLETGEEL